MAASNPGADGWPLSRDGGGGGRQPFTTCRISTHRSGAEMPKKIRDADGLTFGEGRFANHLAHGMGQAEAFRQTWPKSRASAASVHERASRLANSPAVKARVREILAQMKLSDLDNAPQAYRDLLTSLEEAKASKNWTAVAALSRLRLDCLGMLKTSHAGIGDHGLSDEILLDKLAGDNVELRKQLQQLLGSDNFESASTKH
jgi:hypothetical protein